MQRKSVIARNDAWSCSRTDDVVAWTLHGTWHSVVGGLGLGLNLDPQPRSSRDCIVDLTKKHKGEPTHVNKVYTCPVGGSVEGT
jgi:hypothetical protein